MSQLGAMLSTAWDEDPKRLAFTFARYKFVAKMLAGFDRVLEVGCGDSTGGWIVAQHVGELVGIDRDSDLLSSAPKHPTIKLACHDIVVRPLDEVRLFTAAFALDVLEHIHAQDEDAFLVNICRSLVPHGTFIIGMPSLESQIYASGRSKRGHVNCKTEEGLKCFLANYFHNVYSFGMNDETLHTGFGPMCHYRLALANTPRRN